MCYVKRKGSALFDDSLPEVEGGLGKVGGAAEVAPVVLVGAEGKDFFARSEEHTSELQSQSNLVCRLLLEKKKTTDRIKSTTGKSGHARSSLARPIRSTRSAPLPTLSSVGLAVSALMLSCICAYTHLHRHH